MDTTKFDYSVKVLAVLHLDKRMMEVSQHITLTFSSYNGAWLCLRRIPRVLMVINFSRLGTNRGLLCWERWTTIFAILLPCRSTLLLFNYVKVLYVLQNEFFMGKIPMRLAQEKKKKKFAKTRISFEQHDQVSARGLGPCRSSFERIKIVHA